MLRISYNATGGSLKEYLSFRLFRDGASTPYALAGGLTCRNHGMDVARKLHLAGLDQGQAQVQGCTAK